MANVDIETVWTIWRDVELGEAERTGEVRVVESKASDSYRLRVIYRSALPTGSIMGRPIYGGMYAVASGETVAFQATVHERPVPPTPPHGAEGCYCPVCEAARLGGCDKVRWTIWERLAVA